MKTATVIDTVPNHAVKERALAALLNNFGVKAYFITASGRDTEFCYSLMTEQKLGRCRLEIVRAFVGGLKLGMS